MPGAINRITVAAPDSEVLARLKSVDKLTVCCRQDEHNQSTILFKRAGRWDRLYARFLMSRKERRERAEMVVSRFKNLLNIENNDHWLLANIRQKIEAKGVIKGEFLAKNIQMANTRFKLDSDQFLIAPKSGDAVALINESPDRVGGDYQVLSYQKGNQRIFNEIPKNVKSSDLYAEADNQIASDKYYRYFGYDSENNWEGSFAVFYTVCDNSGIAVMPPANWLSYEATVKPEQFFKLLGRKLSGAVVMEPLPDYYFSDLRKKITSATSERFTDQNLKAQLRAAYAINAENHSRGDSVVITFATEDPALFKRLNEINSKLTKELKNAEIHA